MVRLIEDHRETYGVEPICAVLPIAPATYSAQRDDGLRAEIQRVFDANFGVYGPRKVWRPLRREGHTVARCTVERLMRALGLSGAVRGRAWVTTTQSQPALDRPRDLVDRQCVATRQNQLWVSDFTYVAPWGGLVYVAFVIDAFARRIVGWKVSTSPTADFVLDALEQAIHARRPGPEDSLVHHSDRGVQYLAMNYTQRLAEAEAVASVGSKGDSYDNAMAEALNSLFKAECIRNPVMRPNGGWKSVTDVEIAVAEYVDWFNHRRLHGELGLIPPAEYETNHWASTDLEYYPDNRVPAGAGTN